MYREYINNNSKEMNKIELYFGVLQLHDSEFIANQPHYCLKQLDNGMIPIISPHIRKKLDKLLYKFVEIIGVKKQDAFGNTYLKVKKIRRINLDEYNLLIENQNIA